MASKEEDGPLIKVKVTYLGRSFEDTFNLQNKVQKVVDAAAKEFGISDADLATYDVLLEVPGGVNQQLVLESRLGESHVQDGSCLILQPPDGKLGDHES